MNSNIDHMIEVLGWVKEGKALQRSERGREFEDIAPPPYVDGFPIAAVRAIEHGDKYRLKPTPKRRPFTEKEAQRLVGCVSISSTVGAQPFVLTSIPNAAIRHDMLVNQWHYHLPGHPDDLKPCWVEES